MTEEQTNVRPDFDSFAIVELMGHVRIAGRVTEVELFGSKLGKVDVVDRVGGTIATQYFGGSSVYRITPCTEETARCMAERSSGQMPDVAWDVRRAIRAEMEEDAEQERKRIEARPVDDDDDGIVF